MFCMAALSGCTAITKITACINAPNDVELSLIAKSDKGFRYRVRGTSAAVMRALNRPMCYIDVPNHHVRPYRFGWESNGKHCYERTSTKICEMSYWVEFTD